MHHLTRLTQRLTDVPVDRHALDAKVERRVLALAWVQLLVVIALGVTRLRIGS